MDVMYNMTIVNNTVLYVWKLLRVDLESFYLQENIVTMYCDGC